MLVSVIKKGEKHPMLRVNLWRLEVKPQNLVACLVPEVCLRLICTDITITWEESSALVVQLENLFSIQF